MENNAEIQIRSGDRLKECLKMAGMTQKYFAENVVFMSKTQINNIITGKSELTPENARLFASKLKITVDGYTDTVDPKYLLCQSEYMTMGNFIHDLSNREEEKTSLFRSIMELYGYRLFGTVESIREYSEDLYSYVTSGRIQILEADFYEKDFPECRKRHIMTKARTKWERYPLDDAIEKYVLPNLSEEERINFAAARARNEDAINPFVPERLFVLVDIRSDAWTFMSESEATQFCDNIDFLIRSNLARPFQKKIAGSQEDACYNRKVFPQHLAE